jgi:hypothetical protein
VPNENVLRYVLIARSDKPARNRKDSALFASPESRPLTRTHNGGAKSSHAFDPPRYRKILSRSPNHLGPEGRGQSLMPGGDLLAPKPKSSASLGADRDAARHVRHYTICLANSVVSSLKIEAEVEEGKERSQYERV